jgi:hypothetical protein
MLKTGKRVLTKGAETAGGAGSSWHRVVVSGKHTRGRSGAGSKSRVAAEHGNARAILRAAERDHVLANVAANDLAVLSAAVG